MRKYISAKTTLLTLLMSLLTSSIAPNILYSLGNPMTAILGLLSASGAFACFVLYITERKKSVSFAGLLFDWLTFVATAPLFFYTVLKHY